MFTGKKRPVTPSELWNNKKEKTDTKTPIQCEKCMSHADLMVKNASQGMKNLFFSHILAVNVRTGV